MSMLLRRIYEDIQGVAETVAPSEPKKPEEKKPADKGLEYTAKDIKMMNGAKLRKLAKESGIEDPEELTVGELKAILVDKYS